MLQECSESWLPGEVVECSFFPMTFPLLLSGDHEASLGAWSFQPLPEA